MRKFSLLSLVTIFMLLLSACGQEATTSTAVPPPTATQGATQPTTAPAAAQPTATQAAAAPSGGKVTLTIESWRNDDLSIWQDKIIPAFEAKNPNIHVVFAPTAPTEYNAALNTKLQGGTAGDLISCRPFDASLALYQQNHLVSLNDLPGMENFGSVAKSAWITDDGKTVFCVPMASVIHGFIYNKDAFDKLGLKPPTTQAEFMAVLDAIKKDGTYIPLAMGTAEQWESATMGFQNIGPNYWHGEDGRLALIAGKAKFTDQPYIDTWKALAAWAPYLPPGYQAQKYADSQAMFTLGRAAIYPAGSWEIALFNQQAKFKMGAFPPPVAKAGDPLYISDHTDIAMGLNASSKHAAEARTFLAWLATPEFATLYSNALPGFFSLSNQKVDVQDPLAQVFLSWRGMAKTTIRNSYQILSRGEPNLENELWRITAGVMNGTITPDDAGKQTQAGLDKWYKPAGQGAATQPTATQAAAAPSGEKVTLTIESWRNDDLSIWQDKIIPAFEAKNPNIHVVFAPTAPTEYNAALNTKLAGGTAGDLVSCRPFDASLALYQQKHLVSLNDLPGMENFGSVAKSAWITDDGKTVFCVPMASVIHGFIYNKDAFDKLGLKPPTTQAEFMAVLDAIKKDGTYIPLAMGTADQWESATMGFQNIGPNYWHGEDGRLALIAGKAKFTDQPYIDTWKALAAWAPYLPPGYQAQKYPDSQSMFTLGRAAIYPAGSWEIALFNQQAKFKMGAFPPPVAKAGDPLYISDHTDIAMGLNASSKHAAEAKTFLAWLATPEFATLYSNALPGFFSLSNQKVDVQDPLAQVFLSWRGMAKTTIRNSYQILSRGEPNLENELWRITAGVMNGTITPDDAGKQAQAGLDKWYKPAGQ